MRRADYFVYRHNMHYYLNFFKKIRSSIADGTLDVLERLVTKQFAEHQEQMNKGKEKVMSVEN